MSVDLVDQVELVDRADPVGSASAAPRTPAATTWGALLRLAERETRAGTALLLAGGSAGRTTTAEAVGAHLALMAAVAATWRVVWDGACPTAPFDRLDGCLRPLTPAPIMARGTGVAARWRGAGAALRSAGELLATHRGPDGAARSPEAALLGTPAVRLGAASELSRLLLVAMAAAPMLTDSVRPRSLSPTRRMVELSQLTAAARRCADAVAPSVALAGLRVARPDVRTEPCEAALQDRLLRVRLCAWELAEGRPLSAAGLAAIAAVAVELNRIAGPAASRPLAWLRLRRGLSELHTVWPAPVLVVADLMAIRWLCRHTGQAAVDDEVRAAVRQLPQLARWGAAAIAGSPRTELYISAHALRGDEVSERPELVRAKLAGRVVRAPYDRVAAVRDSYAEAALG